MKKILFPAYFLFFLLFSVACSSSDDDEVVDEENPVLNITSPSSVETTQFTSPNYVTFSGTVSDDVELKDLVVTLKFKSLPEYSQIVGDFSTKIAVIKWDDQTQTFNLSDTKSKTYLNEQLFESIPANITTGYYTMTFTLTDAKDKEATIITRTIKIN